MRDATMTALDLVRSGVVPRVVMNRDPVTFERLPVDQRMAGMLRNAVIGDPGLVVEVTKRDLILRRSRS